MSRDIQITPGHNPSVTLQLDMDSSEPLVSMWFELIFGIPLEIDLCLGPQNGSRPVNQTLRLSLSDAFCPFRDLATLAERAVKYQLPFAFEIDSEGPESEVSLRPGPIEGGAIFEIRDLYDPVVYLLALVDARQCGLALAYALRVGIENPANRENWEEWSCYGSNAMNYFGSSWLRDVQFDAHPSKDWYYDGIDHANEERYYRR